MISFCIKTSLTSKRLQSHDLYSKPSQWREIPKLGDPRSSIGIQNVISNLCPFFCLRRQFDFIFFSQPFPFNEIMYFQSSSLCFYYTSLSTFRNPKSGSSKTILKLYTENEWPNCKGYNSREFTKLIG
jgi:hypothetical protein